MRAQFRGYRAHYRLWVNLSQHKHSNWLTGANMTAHFQNFRRHYRLGSIYLSLRFKMAD